MEKTAQEFECDECGAVVEVDTPDFAKALHKVAHKYGCNGTREGDLIAEAFRALALELEIQS